MKFINSSRKGNQLVGENNLPSGEQSQMAIVTMMNKGEYHKSLMRM